jgi:hypothetical protein
MGMDYTSLPMIAASWRRRGYGHAVVTALERYLQSSHATERVSSAVQTTALMRWFFVNCRGQQSDESTRIQVKRAISFPLCTRMDGYSTPAGPSILVEGGVGGIACHLRPEISRSIPPAAVACCLLLPQRPPQQRLRATAATPRSQRGVCRRVVGSRTDHTEPMPPLKSVMNRCDTVLATTQVQFIYGTARSIGWNRYIPDDQGVVNPG